MEKKRVLILDGYARQTMPMAKGFKQNDCEVTVACFSRLDVGYWSRWPDHKILMECAKTDYPKQYETVKAWLEEDKFDLVVPMTDYSATYLAKNKEYLSKYAYIAVNDWSVFELAIDKLKTMRICQDNGIPAPKTLFTENVKADIDNIDFQYPLVIKPRSACGSIGFNIVQDKEHLLRLLANDKNTNGPLFIQEYIPQKGSQYGAEAFRDRNGNFSFILIDEKPRWFPLDGGSPTINITIHNEQMETMTRKLLDAMNWNGYANIDFVLDERDDIPKIIEINGRISAAAMIDFKVSIDVAKVILENAFSEKITEYKTYPDNVKTSCILTEILWFTKSKERFKQKPSFLNRKKTSDVIFSWSDPLPFFVFCVQSAMNYRHAMEQRKRK